MATPAMAPVTLPGQPELDALLALDRLSAA
jgi:hypothetical protein